MQFLTDPIPHAEAVKLIADKPAITREIFDQLLQEHKGRAFTISGIEAFDVMQSVQDKIAALPAGADWKKLRKQIAAEISPWLGEEEGLRRAKLLLNHHGRAAYAATNARVIHAQADVFTHLMYRSSRTSKEPRGSHRALDGMIFPTNHPFWETHTPPWEFGCNCMDPIPLTQEDADEAPPSKVANPAQLAALEKGNFVSGNNIINIQTPRGKSGGAAGYEWSWRDTTLPYEEIRKRWTPDVAEAFEEWAGKHTIGGGVSLMSWLHPTGTTAPRTLGEFGTASPGTVEPAWLASLVRAEPNHEVAKALKLWGDDEDTFSELMREDDAAALAWRDTMDITLSKLKPVPDKPLLYRGWSFKTAEEMDDFLVNYKDHFEQDRVGMSGTFDLTVAARPKFSGGAHSMIWAVSDNRRAVDMRPLFEAVNAQAYRLGESEVIFPQRTILDWSKPDPEYMEVADSHGNKRMMAVYYLTER